MGEFVAIGEVTGPIGRLRVAVTRVGVVRISFARESGEGFTGWLRRRVPDAEEVDWLPDLDRVRRELDEYFAGTRRTFEVPLDLRGTDFQLSCWRALQAIPYGETRSYAEVAENVGRPRAVRAVGAANGANPIPLIVPCHRVINTSGKLGGFGGGLDVKKRLLAFEGGSGSGDLL